MNSTASWILFLFGVLIFGFLVWLSVALGPTPTSANEWAGVAAGILALMVGAVVPYALSASRDRREGAREKEAEYSAKIGEICDSLVSSTGRATARIELALSDSGQERSHMTAARDNAQQITNVILQLSSMCGRNIEETKDRIRKVQDEVNTMGDVLVRDHKEKIADFADIGSRLETQAEELRRELERAKFAMERPELMRFLEGLDEVQEEISQKIDDLQTSIQQAAHVGSVPIEPKPTVDPSQPKKELTTLACPICNETTRFELGVFPGDSAMAVCPNSHRFHAHRGRQGIFARKPGGSTAVQQQHRFDCPNSGCGQKIPLTIYEGLTAPQIRWCFTCGSKCELDPVSRTASLVALREIVRAPWAGNSVCPRHGTQLDEFGSNDSGTIGLCRSCDGLVQLQKINTSRSNN